MSQFGDSSGISRSTISPDKKYLATAGGSGECKLWDIETATLKSTFHPQSLLTLSPQSFANVAIASADLSIRLWTLDLNDLNQIEVENLGMLQKSNVLKGHEVHSFIIFLIQKKQFFYSFRMLLSVQLMISKL